LPQKLDDSYDYFSHLQLLAAFANHFDGFRNLVLEQFVFTARTATLPASARTASEPLNKRFSFASQ
jgi:hypothetical protein